jgi:RimJ/RimL family protein N-acetyltransferase
MYRSKKLTLRPFTEDDAKYISEMKMDLVGSKGYGGRPFPSNTESEKEWISKMYPAGYLTNIFLAIEETETKQFIGHYVASNVNYINSNAHVGMIFHKNGRGKGYAKEASILFYGYLFNEINLHKVYSEVLVYNEIALRTYLKIGFKIDGILREHMYQSGSYHDLHIVSLTAKDFFEAVNLDEYLLP